ncbi:MAG: DUF3788 domain-containing protein [Chloroflexota bacterium]|nr:MAG: DUF3788 domain-containing protein [Chloroflexota bacterium]
MSIGYFADKTQPPSAEELRAALGLAYPLWERLIKFIDDNYQMAVELSYGGKNYGWNLWYRKSGKPLVSLYPKEGCLVAQVVLGKDQVAKALELSLGETVGRMLRETPQFHDGKWLFIPVNTEIEVEDVEKLLLVKRRPLRKPAGGN